MRSEVQKVVLDHQGRYGYRRVTAELRRRGMLVNHKRVARLMREDSLLVARSALPSASSHARGRGEIYINLANRMTTTGTYQLWVADITFVRLKTGAKRTWRRSIWISGTFVLFTGGALLIQLWSKNLKDACGNRGYLVVVMKIR